MNSFGYTEAGYKGPAGEGEGHLLPGVKKSKFYPDGYYLHRSFWICSDRIVTADAADRAGVPDGVRSARSKRWTRTSRPMSRNRSTSTGDWMPALGAKVVEDEVLFQRGWIWPTEGDAAAITQISNFMVEGRLIPKPLAWDQVKSAFAKAAPLLQKAYDATGKVPAESGFTDSERQGSARAAGMADGRMEGAVVRRFRTVPAEVPASIGTRAVN